MAEGNDENSPEKSNSYKNLNCFENSDGDEMKPDLGNENTDVFDKRTYSSENHSTPGSSDTPKREENPFSFKHFLKRDTQNSYHSQGARPKVYNTSNSLNLDTNVNVVESTQPRIAPEFSSALPDFVQDHLVIEQCYLGNDTSPQEISVALDNLPDFTPKRKVSRVWKSSKIIERRNRRDHSNLPLDLPGVPNVGFPLDLPITEPQSINSTRSCPQSVEVGVSKSLPDFLSDGAVYSQPEENNTAGQSPEHESDTLQRELDLCRSQLSEQTRRAHQLQRQLDASRNKETEYTHNLTKAMEQIEENLNISNRRANAAENTVAKLKQDIKQLTMEVSQLQIENRTLRGEEGATGGPGYSSNVDTQMQRFAHELRSAAGTAELSLRQLLGGVDNLRMMAASLENMYRIEERTETFIPDLDEDPGPAL